MKLSEEKSAEATNDEQACSDNHKRIGKARLLYEKFCANPEEYNVYKSNPSLILYEECFYDVLSGLTTFNVFWDYLINRPIQQEAWLWDVAMRIATAPVAIILSVLTQLIDLVIFLPLLAELAIDAIALLVACIGKIGLTIALNLPIYCVDAVIAGFNFLSNIISNPPPPSQENNLTREGTRVSNTGIFSHNTPNKLPVDDNPESPIPPKNGLNDTDGLNDIDW
jgi:hypothetical protein